MTGAGLSLRNSCSRGRKETNVSSEHQTEARTTHSPTQRKNAGSLTPCGFPFEQKERAWRTPPSPGHSKITLLLHVVHVQVVLLAQVKFAADDNRMRPAQVGAGNFEAALFVITRRGRFNQ